MFNFISSLFKKKTVVQAVQIPTAPIYFDAEYYLLCYPDVEQAGVDAWGHFYHHGYQEGRWPCRLEAVSVEPMLWDEDTAPQAEQELRNLLLSPNEAEKTSAAWLLGRWYAARGQWQAVQELMAFYVQADRPIPGLLAPHLLWIESLSRVGSSQAIIYLDRLEKQLGARVDLTLTRMNVLSEDKNDLQSWQRLNQHYASSGLMKICSDAKTKQRAFDGMGVVPDSVASKSGESILVSVIVPTYNAEKTIVTALKSLLLQTWSSLEIIVVDDASEDQSTALVEELAIKDSRIRLIRQEKNRGAYHARNVGLAQSQGRFITVHDSDDWSHPQKIEMQVRPLLQSREFKATLSHWVRADEQLFFGGWGSTEDWNGLVHRNVSSLMMRRDVFDELGFWDDVVCSADTEYYYRIITAYGAAALYEVHGGLPLAFGRIRGDSLTQCAETHVFSVLSGLRKEYSDAYKDWHQCSTSKGDLYMSQYMETRPFDVNAMMLRKKSND